MSTDKLSKLDRYKEHSIDLVLKKITIKKNNENEIKKLINSALLLGKGSVGILKTNEKLKINCAQDSKQKLFLFSQLNACPQCNLGFNELDPRLFSFNSKMGWCKACQGSGIKKNF